MQLGAGFSNYFGDIGGSADEDNLYGLKDLKPLRTRPAFGGGLRYNYTRFISFGGNAALGWLSGDDAGGRNAARDYVFNTVIFELTGRAEFFFVKDYSFGSGVDRRGMVRNYATFSAYLFGGGGPVLYFVLPNDNLRERRDRDNIEHGFMTLVLPAGAGVKFGIGNIIDLGVEIGGRYSLNDYLDGFTSPAATSNDIYYITSFSLVYRLESLYF